jgi:hypothetical protein
MENNLSGPSFICSKCNCVTIYNPSDYIDYNLGKQLLLEMTNYKHKTVLIPCDNQSCRNLNSIQITYI